MIKSILRKFRDVAYCLPSEIAVALDPKVRAAYKETKSLYDQPERQHIAASAHNAAASRVVANYKLQKESEVAPIYMPGVMWGNIINSLKSFANWDKNKDADFLAKCLEDFYRSDMITCFGGDFYFKDYQEGKINVKRQVYGAIKRFNEFFANSDIIPISAVDTTDIGHNMYVKYGERKLSYQKMRHCHNIQRMIKNKTIHDGQVCGEIGSGAMEMAIASKRCFPKSTFVCFDLPSTLLVGSYNVLMHYPDAKVGLYENFKDKMTIERSDLAQYDFVLLPNWMIERISENSFDAFWNFGSLSEMDIEIIGHYLKCIGKSLKGQFYTINRNVKTFELGAYDVPVDNYPLPQNFTKLFQEYDKASDSFHSPYGFGKVNYHEVLFKVS